MNHEYKVYYTADKAAENGIKEKVLKRLKRCFTSLRESVVDGWLYCPHCPYVESPDMVRFDAALAAAVGTPAAVPA